VTSLSRHAIVLCLLVKGCVSHVSHLSFCCQVTACSVIGDLQIECCQEMSVLMDEKKQLLMFVGFFFGEEMVTNYSSVT